MRKSLFILIALTTAVAGCQSGPSHMQTQKEQATKHWNAARGSVLAGLAKDQYESGAFEKSRITVTEALRLDPKNSNLHVLSAKLAIEAGQIEMADHELKTARELDEKNAEADYLSGVVAQRWQKPGAAHAFYQAAAEKQPAEPAYVLAEAEMLVALDRSGEALDLLRSRSADFEHSAVMRDAIGQILVQQSKWTDAAEVFREAVILDSEEPAYREHLGMAQFFAGSYRESADTLSRLLKDPSYAKRSDVISALGQCQMQMGRPRDAKSNFETVAQLKPAASESWTNLAQASMALGDLPRADLALRKALMLESSSSETNLLMGYLRLRQARLDDALAAFRKAHELAKDDSVSLCMIGYVLEKQGRSEQAIAFYAKALKLKPNDELAERLIARVEPRL